MEIFGGDAKVYIFGSQLDDARRGGDIDVYIETSIKDASELVELKIFFLMGMEKYLGERKLDVVVNNLAAPKNLPIYSAAKRGMLL